jgi:excisionase family DNA binding protein
MTGEKLLIAEEVADLTQLPIEHIYRLARRGDLESVRFGRYVRFTKLAIDNFIDANTKKAS